MTDLFGNYKSQTTRALSDISSSKYPDTNKDFEKNIRRLNEFVDYIAQYLQTMQKGVDQANQDPISKIRSTILDMGTLFAGGELLYGINLGDLQYFLPALGALFGFDSSVPFPINLLYAAEHFLLGYIIPLDSWQIAVEDIIDGWATALGLSPEFMDAVHDLLDAMGRFTGDLMGVFNDFAGLLGIFNIFSPTSAFGTIWSSLVSLLSQFNITNLGAIVDPFLETLTPWIELLAQIINTVDDLIEAFTGGVGGGTGTMLNPQNWIGDLLGIFGLGSSSGLGTGISNVVFDAIENIPIFGQFASPFINAITGSFTTGGGGVLGLFNIFSDFFGIFGNLGGLGTGTVTVESIIADIPFLNQIPFLPELITLLGPILNPILAIFSTFGIGSAPVGTNPVNMVASFITNFLNPSGLLASAAGIADNVLTSLTQIPAMLLGGLTPGSSSNLVPDPFFTLSSALDGLGLWNWSNLAPATDLNGNAAPAGAGSWQVTADGSHQQLMSLPFPIPSNGLVSTNPIMAGAKLLWTSLVGTGDTMLVALDSYTGQNADGSMIQPPITDPNRIIAKVTNPTTNSSAFSGHDGTGWAPTKGAWVPPAGAKFATLSFEVLPAASSGTVNFGTGLFDVPNFLDASRLANLENIPQLLAQSVKGFEDMVDMVGTFAHLFDGMGTAASGIDQIGLTFADLFAVIQDLAFNADMGGTQGAINTNILGIRTNKSVGAGANSTSEAMHAISLFGTGGTMTTTSLAPGNAISQTFRASEVAQKGFFEFIAAGTTLTNIFTNIYGVDASTGAKTKLWGSNDISGLIPTSLSIIKSLIPGGSQPTINAGQNLLLEIVNGGANPLTVVTRNTGQPNHGTDFPKNLGATRVLASTGGNSPASLTDAQVTYSANHPYVNLGIANVPPGYVAPQLQQFTANGTWTRPGGFVDGDYVDCFVLGGAGGGQSGGYGLSGSGGEAGHWTTQSFVLGSDPKGTGLPILPNSTTTLSVVVGQGGGGGINPFALNPGATGTASTVSGAGITTLTAAPGIGGGLSGCSNNGNTGGQGAGQRQIADYTAFGGPATSVNGSAGQPGGGGPSGYPAVGNNGANGKVWIRTRQQ